MRSGGETPTAVMVVLAIGIACLSCACGAAAHEARPFPDAGRRTEEALRELGRTLFDVVSFRTEGGEGQALRDSYRHEMSTYRIRFVADIRYERDVHALSREQTMERLRQPDATGAEIEQAIMLRRLLGVAPHARGSTQVLRNVAVFEETESGWRVVALDGPEFEIQ